MKTSQVVLIALVTPTIVQICLAMLPKEGNKSMRCVHMPQYFWVISVITGVMCAVLGLVGWLKQLVICIVFAICLGIISCVFLLMYRSLYIVYNDAGFTVKRIFRLTRQFSYEEIEAVTFGHSLLQFTLHTKKGRIFVDQLAVGQISFYKYTEGKYQEATGRRTIPQKEPRLFHGYVRNSGEIAFFPCLVLVLLIAAAVLITGDSLKLLDAPKELLRRNVQITSWSTENDMVYFTTAYGKLWVQRDVIADFEVLQSDMDQGQTFSVIFEPSGNESNAAGALWSLQDGEGIFLVSQEIVMENNQKIAWKNIGGIWAMVLIYSLLLCGGYYILCHAPAHPRLASLLIKKEYRNF